MYITLSYDIDLKRGCCLLIPSLGSTTPRPRGCSRCQHPPYGHGHHYCVQGIILASVCVWSRHVCHSWCQITKMRSDIPCIPTGSFANPSLLKVVCMVKSLSFLIMDCPSNTTWVMPRHHKNTTTSMRHWLLAWYQHSHWRYSTPVWYMPAITRT